MRRYYVGLDVHKASICIAVLNAADKLVMESVVETSAATVLDFVKGLRGQVEVTFEEGPTPPGSTRFCRRLKRKSSSATPTRTACCATVTSRTRLTRASWRNY